MCRLEHQLADIDVCIELFAHLASERVDVTLSGVDLASGKLPQSGEMDAFWTTRHEKRVVLFNDGSDDGDRGRQWIDDPMQMT